MIDIKKLRELVKLMAANDLTEVDLEDENERICLRRGATGQVTQVAPTPTAPGSAAPAPDQAAPSQPASAEAPAAPDAPTIKSPMVGTFYAASSPDAKPYAKAGDKVSPDTVVCIIEAMKVFNEIKADVAGEIAEVLVKNGDTVEFGQPLFRLK